MASSAAEVPGIVAGASQIVSARSAVGWWAPEIAPRCSAGGLLDWEKRAERRAVAAPVAPPTAN
eukprot:11200200-Lingulodinium_polyedra.AAC.1